MGDLFAFRSLQRLFILVILCTMEPEYIALFISVISVVVAAFSLGWNVYRDVLLRPRVRVRYHIRHCAGGIRDGEDVIYLSATNMGPTRIRLTMIHFNNTKLWGWLTRKRKHGFIMHDWRDPAAWQIPCWVEVGETAQFFFPICETTEWARDTLKIGFLDSFDRFHWCRKKDAAEVRTEFERLNPNKESVS